MVTRRWRALALAGAFAGAGFAAGGAEAQDQNDPRLPDPGAPPFDEGRSTPVPSIVDDAASVTDPAAPDAPAHVPPPVVVPPAAAPAPETVIAPTTTLDRTPRSRVGLGAAVGGGVIGFTDEQARSFTETGGSWEARLSVGTRLPLALEAAYIGSAQGIDALGLDGDATLIGNGAEGALRLNLSPTSVQPYVFGGLGWTRYRLSGSDQNRSSLRGGDDVVNVPFGVGLALRPASGFLVDFRATGRAAFDDELMDLAYASTGEDARLHSWNVAARLGWEF